MNSTGKIQNKGQVTIPTSVRRQAGLSKGDLVNFVFQRGKIIITPKVTIDRSKFPTADGDYTPAQRHAIDAQLAEAADDVRKGRVSRKFETVEEMLVSLKAKSKRKTTRAR